MSTVPTIAIIDDDEEVRIATENLVQSYGIDTQTFGSAEEFLNSAAADEAACLITDIQMPGMSGVDLQKTLLEQGRRVPIIFMTAFPEERVRRQVEAAGAIRFLSKPYAADALMDSISEALGGI